MFADRNGNGLHVLKLLAIAVALFNQNICN
jgi:hypothetical protein